RATHDVEEGLPRLPYRGANRDILQHCGMDEDDRRRDATSVHRSILRTAMLQRRPLPVRQHPPLPFPCLSQRPQYSFLRISYFNPPEPIERKYITEIAKDLGMDFGLEKEGAFGGDIEVFACKVRFR